jgi:hypothetical protein
MRVIVLIAAIAAALILSACATVNYLYEEYGTADKDGSVLLEDGTNFWIWLHKSKPKMIVSVDVAGAAATGFITGLTFGATSGAPPQPLFERAAARWFAEHRPNCHTTKAVPIEKVQFEFDYECSEPVVVRPNLPTGRKK